MLGALLKIENVEGSCMPIEGTKKVKIEGIGGGGGYLVECNPQQ